MKHTFALLAGWVAVLASLPFAQQQLPPAEPQLFRTGIDAVQLDVSVSTCSAGLCAA